MELAHRAEAEGRRPAQPIERGRLMGILAIPQRHRPLALEAERWWKRIGHRGIRSLRREEGRDRPIVGRGAAEGLTREAIARVVSEAAARRAQLVDHGSILRRVRDDRDARVVLGRGPDHGRPADVDLLDRLRQGHIRPRHRRLKGIERHHDQVDGRDPVLLERVQVRGHVATRQDPPVDLGMQGLHAPVHHLGKSGDVRDVANGDARFPQEPRRPARREDLDAERGQRAAQIDEPGLVVNAHQRAADFHALSFTRTRRPVMTRRPSANSRIASG